MKQLLILGIIAMAFLCNCSENPVNTILDAFKDAPAKEQFKVFHHIFNKSYDLNSEEGLRRYKIFKENLKMIKEVNDKKLSYTFGINQFADLTKEEFQKMYLMPADLKKKAMKDTVRFLEQEGYFDAHAEDDDTPAVAATLNPLDWRRYYRGIRDQNPCGSCWAFATTGLIEGRLAVRQGAVLPDYFSPQQLVDCDPGNNGCHGGLYEPALKYIYNNGISWDAQYPYKADKFDCKAFDRSKTQKIRTYSYCSNYMDKPCSREIVYGFLQSGPGAVGVDGYAIEYYRGGVYKGEACSQDNHAVLLVGYGVDPVEGEYWLLRNSWGTWWGESGYGRVSLNAQNHGCYLHNEIFIVGF